MRKDLSRTATVPKSAPLRRPAPKSFHKCPCTNHVDVRVRDWLQKQRLQAWRPLREMKKARLSAPAWGAFVPGHWKRTRCQSIKNRAPSSSEPEIFLSNLSKEVRKKELWRRSRR